MANASVAMYDPTALWGNIAGIGQVNGFTAISGFEDRFQMPAFRTMMAGCILPFEHWTGGIQVSRFGDKYFHEQQLGIGAAHQIEGVTLGTQVMIHQVGIAHWGSAWVPTWHVGVVMKVHPKIWLGSHIRNVLQAKLGEQTKQGTQHGAQMELPSTIRLGLHFQPVKNLQLNAEAEKWVHDPLWMKFGVEYRLEEIVFVRSGYHSGIRHPYFGVGLLVRQIRVDYALNPQFALGVAQQFTLTFFPPVKQP